jgi:hypothetical protein
MKEGYISLKLTPIPGKRESRSEDDDRDKIAKTSTIIVISPFVTILRCIQYNLYYPCVFAPSRLQN